MRFVCGRKMSFAPDGASAYKTERGRRGHCPSPFFRFDLVYPAEWKSYMKPEVNHLPVRLIFVRRRTRTGISRAPAAGAQAGIARNGTAPDTQNR